MRKPIHLDENNNTWVTEGKITFQNYTTKYRLDTGTVLNNLNIEIKPGEKIGVVGRAGAGKTTILSAICRFIEAIEGKIEIDGVDISQVGLDDLRENISVIPQEPAIFENTLRFNIDPNEKTSDEHIIELLTRASLQNLILQSTEGLDLQIKNWDLSLGQKQLICICRSILTVSDAILCSM